MGLQDLWLTLRLEQTALVLQMLGDGVMRPFLQDTIQFWPLSAAMTGTLFVAPLTIIRVLFQVGPFPGHSRKR